MGMFDMFSDSGGTQRSKTKSTTVQTLSPYSQALQTLLARFLLMRMQNLQDSTFGNFRQTQTLPTTPLTLYPRESQALPGVSDATGVPGVNPILLNYKGGIRRS